MFMSRSLVTRTVAIAALSAVALSGCSKPAEKDSTPTSTVKETATSTVKSTETTTAKEKTHVAAALTADNVHLHDAFVKAVPEGKSMTAVFGVLENHTDAPIHLVGFSTDLKAKMYQIHEVVEGVMQEKKGGITVEPNSKVELKPGGDHLMIMGLQQAVEAGSKITVTLKFDDGSTVEIKDVPARALGAGDESYGDSSHKDGDMKMDHKDGDMKMDHKDGDMKMDHKDGDMKMDHKDGDMKMDHKHSKDSESK